METEPTRRVEQSRQAVAEQRTLPAANLIIAADDKLVVCWTIKGSTPENRTPFRSRAETFSMSGVAIYRFVNGTIEDDWGIQVSCPLASDIP